MPRDVFGTGPVGICPYIVLPSMPEQPPSEGAELLLTGAVTEFEPDKFGIGGIFVGLGTLIGSAVLHEKEGAFPVGAATYRESHIALDLRLIETASSRILAAVSA